MTPPKTTPHATDAMWAAIKSHLAVQTFSEVSWRQVYAAKQELGFPLLPHERAALGGTTPVTPRIEMKEQEEQWWDKLDK